MERRSFVRGAGIAGVLAAGAAPAIVQAQAQLRRLQVRLQLRHALLVLIVSGPGAVDVVLGGGARACQLLLSREFSLGKSSSSLCLL